MNNRPIGIIDSGVGGLSIWKEIKNELPLESTVYVGDSANAPYGHRSAEDIYTLSSRLISYLLLQYEAKIIVIACNSITVTCLEQLRETFPDIPIVGTVPVIKTAAEQSVTKRIGILSTTGTSQSDYQKNLITKFAGDCDVITIGTDELVPFIEAGESETQECQRIIDKTVEPFIQHKIDVLVLGCTHYPFILNALVNALGSEVRILDSSAAIARQVRRILLERDELNVELAQKHLVLTTDSVTRLKAFAKNNVVELDETVVIQAATIA